VETKELVLFSANFAEAKIDDAKATVGN